MDAALIHKAVREGVIRGITVVGLAAIALIHLVDVPGKFTETPYLAWMYVALIIGCIAVAGALIRDADPRAFVAAAGLALSVIVGYTLSRTAGLPQASGDIGNWSEPLGIASLFVEGSVAATCAFALFERARERERMPSEAYAR
jgi:hypothetical protein